LSGRFYGTAHAGRETKMFWFWKIYGYAKGVAETMVFWALAYNVYVLATG